MKNVCVIMIGILFLTQSARADDQEAWHRQLPRTAARLQAACVQIISRGDHSSGVVITSAGHILCTAHGIHSDAKSVDVHRSKTLRASADILVRDTKSDVALLRLSNASQAFRRNLQPVSMAAVSIVPPPDLQNKVVLAVGFPAGRSSAPVPVIRIGSVSVAESQAIRSTCVLTAGDSGGPLFDDQGRLLGIHRRIGLTRDANLHIPMRVCMKRLSSVLQQHGIPIPKESTKHEQQRISLSPGASVRQTSRLYQIRLQTPESERSSCMATVLTPAAAVTKLSELNGATSLSADRPGGGTIRASVAAQIRHLDLAVLQLDSPLENVESINTSTDEKTTPDAGLLVFSGEHPTAGVIARKVFAETDSRASLGCVLAARGREVYVESVVAGSAASEAGLLPEDRLLQLGDSEVMNLDDVGRVLDSFQPGDLISIRTRRADAVRDSTGRLRHPAAGILNRTEFLDGRAGVLSHRRTGFPEVIQHDCPVGVSEMGGPLIDAAGNIIGVNIARRSREAVIALPLRIVLRATRDATPPKTRGAER